MKKIKIIYQSQGEMLSMNCKIMLFYLYEYFFGVNQLAIFLAPKKSKYYSSITRATVIRKRKELTKLVCD